MPMSSYTKHSPIERVTQYSDVDIASAAIVLHSLAGSGEMAAPRKGGQLADLAPTKC